MQYVRYSTGSEPQFGALVDGDIHPLSGTPLAPVTVEKLAN